MAYHYLIVRRAHKMVDYDRYDVDTESSIHPAPILYLINPKKGNLLDRSEGANIHVLRDFQHLYAQGFERSGGCRGVQDNKRKNIE